jgi:hypothetical protein
MACGPLRKARSPERVARGPLRKACRPERVGFSPERKTRRSERVSFLPGREARRSERGSFPLPQESRRSERAVRSPPRESRRSERAFRRAPREARPGSGLDFWGTPSSRRSSKRSKSGRHPCRPSDVAFKRQLEERGESPRPCQRPDSGGALVRTLWPPKCPGKASPHWGERFLCPIGGLPEWGRAPECSVIAGNPREGLRPTPWCGAARGHL